MMRKIYTTLFYLALPYIFLRLIWLSRRQPAYRQRMRERLGWYPYSLDRCLWVHAVSMGEVIAATPLINRLMAEYPALPLLVTTMTPTGAARVASTFGERVHHAYLPYDLPCAVKRFLESMHPAAGIIVETEIWPNLIAVCHERRIPVCLVNARLSGKSLKGYQRIAGLTKETLLKIDVIAAHAESDAKRFMALGMPSEKIKVTGNIKFDLVLAPDLLQKAEVLRETLGKDRFVWIAASTHEGEEEIILAAHQLLRQKHQHALLILVPRHPDRFNSVAQLCENTFKTERRSSGKSCTQETAVYLGDSMGEMMLMYGACDAAFVGGSLIPRGGHNILEPGALEKPVITGPHLFNFTDISAMFTTSNAMMKVTDADSLSQALLALADDAALRQKMGERAKSVVEKNRGALAAQLEIIKSELKHVNA